MVYKILKILNNNSVLITKDKIMYIAMGAGVGFSKKPGDTIDGRSIQKLFENRDSQFFTKLSTSISKLNEEYYTIVDEIVKYISEALSCTLNDTVYLALAEHISFAVIRLDKNIIVPCPMEYQIKTLYTKEYRIAEDVVKIMQQRLHKKFSKSEVGLIAMHILNSTLDTPKEEVVESFQLVSEIISIIEEYFSIIIDESSLRHTRLLTHLHFLSNRIFMQTTKQDFLDISKHIQFHREFNEAMKCAEIVKQHILDTYQYTLNNDEINYLIIHIQNCIGGIKHD